MNDDLTIFQPKNMEQALRFAEQLATSALMPDALRGKPGDILVTIITGQELGLTAMQSIRGINVIKGKAAMSADLTVALVKRHADCRFFRVVKTSATEATYETHRNGDPTSTALTFSMEDAARAGLSNLDTWKKYPAAMLRARAASALARAVYPDLMLGVYDPDEAREFAPLPEREIAPESPPVVSRVQLEDAEVVSPPTPPATTQPPPRQETKQAETKPAPKPVDPAEAALRARRSRLWDFQKGKGMNSDTFKAWFTGVLGSAKPSKDWTTADLDLLEAAVTPAERVPGQEG